MNFLKKLFDIKKPKVTWSSHIEGLEKIAPIQPASKVIPQWFKDIKQSGVSDGTKIPLFSNIKSCPGFIDYAMQGYVVPLWCDLWIDVNLVKGTQWRTPNRQFEFDFHMDNQFKDYLPKHQQDKIYGILKPNCPWRAFTPKGYSMYQLPMTYHFNEIFEVMTGTIPTDIYHEVNQQMILKKEGEFLIPKGTPLAVYIPYKREKYSFECVHTTEKLRKKTWIPELSISTKFRNRFRANKDTLINNE